MNPMPRPTALWFPAAAAVSIPIAHLFTAAPTRDRSRFPPGLQRTVPTGRKRTSGGISPAATTARRGKTGSSQRLT